MVEVVALAVPLHDVRALLVVDVADCVAGVGAHALTIEPGSIGSSDRILGQSSQHFHGQGRGGDAGPVAEDPPAGRVGQHAVAELRDEEGLGGGFAEGGDHVAAAGVEERGYGAAEGEGGAFGGSEGHMAGVVGWWAGED